MSTPNVSYYVNTANETRGPFSITQLRGMWSNGAITAADQFCISGESEWQPLSMLQDTLEAPAQAPSIQPQQSSPGTAAVLSFLVPGLGQIYRGKIFVGLLLLLVAAVGYAVHPVCGFVYHVLAISFAYRPREVKILGVQLGFLSIALVLLVVLGYVGYAFHPVCGFVYQVIVISFAYRSRELKISGVQLVFLIIAYASILFALRTLKNM